MRATSDEQQLWHRDVPLVHAFSCFMPVNLDCPVDSREDMFVFGSGARVPFPWQEVLMGMLAGNLWILTNYVIHRGGTLPKEAPAASTRIIAFAVIAVCRVNYETTVPIASPPWMKAPVQEPPQSPSPLPTAIHCTTAYCNCLVRAEPPPKCFACDDRLLCVVLANQLGADCQNDSGEDVLAKESGGPQGAARKPVRVHRRLWKKISVGLRLL